MGKIAQMRNGRPSSKRGAGGEDNGARGAALAAHPARFAWRLALPPVMLLATMAAPGAADEAIERLIALDRANPEWLAKAKAAVPGSWQAGRLFHFDETALKARVAVVPRNANDPATPGNPFDPGQVLVIDLVRDGEDLTYAGSIIHSRSPNDVAEDENGKWHRSLLDELHGQAESEPDIMPCRIRGWAVSVDRDGTAVRIEPSEAARIVGRLAPPHGSPESEAAPIDGWRTEFDITGYRVGWFRIENAEAPGTPYDDPPPVGHPETYSGTGWIRTTEAGAAYANSMMPVPRLLLSPHVDAPDFAPGPEASDPSGNLSIDGTLEELHACAANWGLTTSRDGARGWWRGICSNQATNCS